MRGRFIGLTFVIAMVPVVANAQLTIDMGKITCGQYLAMPPSQSDNFSAWMSGWFSYQCPSSDNLRLIRRFAKGGSGSSGVRV